MAKASDGVESYIMDLHASSGGVGRWKHNKGMKRPYALVATRFVVEMLHSMGRLHKLPAQIIDGAKNYMLGSQAEDGFFKDELVRKEDLVDGHCFHWPDLWVQMGCETAMRALHISPRYPLPGRIHGQGENPEHWLYEGDWSNPWLMGDRFNRSVRAALGYPSPGAQVPNHLLEKVEPWFNFVEKKVLNPATGLPDLVGCAEADVAMAGLFKLLFGYVDAQRNFPHMEAAIESTLALQDSQGDFAVRPEIPIPAERSFILRYARDMCINWDAIWVLRALDKQAGEQHCHREIVESSVCLAECLLRDYRKPDGGFAFAADYCLMVHSGVWLSEALPESDIIGTFMCMECLRYADEWMHR